MKALLLLGFVAEQHFAVTSAEQEREPVEIGAERNRVVDAVAHEAAQRVVQPVIVGGQPVMQELQHLGELDRVAGIQIHSGHRGRPCSSQGADAHSVAHAGPTTIRPVTADRYRIFAITCPFHGNAGWRWVRDHDPDGWVEAVEFDRAIRHGYPRAITQGQELRGQYFLHRSCLPLDQVDLDAPAKPRTKQHLRLITTDSADGAADGGEEAGDPDGCSPWSCRSGEPVTATASSTDHGHRERAA